MAWIKNSQTGRNFVIVQKIEMALYKVLKTFLPISLLNFYHSVLYKSKILTYLTGHRYRGTITYSGVPLDKVIYNYLCRITNAKKSNFFIELGANNGITQSNTKYLELYKNYTGILIEPIPQKYKECILNRKESTIVENKACVSFDYSESTIQLTEANLVTTVWEEGGINALEHVSKFGFSKNIFEQKVASLNSILEKNNAPTYIDLLSLDVEGYELEVLKGIDFNKYTFMLLVIESREINILENYLSDKNYILIERLSNVDYIFRHKNSVLRLVK